MQERRKNQPAWFSDRFGTVRYTVRTVHTTGSPAAPTANDNTAQANIPQNHTVSCYPMSETANNVSPEAGESHHSGARVRAAPTAKPTATACLQCQQRKLKCDRKFPCARCIKDSVRCMAGAAIGKERKKRFAEKELLERLRRYEELMRQYNVPFDAMHPQNQSPEPTQLKITTEQQSNSPFETQYVFFLRPCINTYLIMYQRSLGCYKHSRMLPLFIHITNRA